MNPPHTVDATMTKDPWMFHMRRGDFASAWQVSDAVLRQRGGQPSHHLPRHYQWIWDGTPLQGKRVLVRCYHGLGDTVMFIRFAPLLRAIAREVIVWAQPALLPLLRTARGIDRLLPLHDGTPDVDYDVDVESMELAHIFRVTPDTLPKEIPYLHVDARPPRSLPAQARHLDVGVVWSCGSDDATRCMPGHLLSPLLNLAGVRWHVLQRGPAAAEWPGDPNAIDGDDDVIATGKRMRHLDLVLSVDSFPVHLAGAVGVPVWVLLHARADWRWMNDRVDSPWYPTARLFRQPAAEDWPAVIAAVGAELGARLGSSESRRVSNATVPCVDGDAADTRWRRAS